MLPSLGEVLAMAACRRARPQVVAGQDRLGTPVRWVHAMELTDVARLLRGGELVLSTGIALPDDERLLGAYVTELAEVGVAGLAVELGRRYAGSLPAAPVAAARRCGLAPDAGAHAVRAAADRVRARGRVHRDHRGGARPDHRCPAR